MSQGVGEFNCLPKTAWPPTLGIPTDKNTAQAEAMEYEIIDGTVIVPVGTVEIKPYAFSQRSDIKSVSLPEGLLKIGEYAFEKCPNLKTIVIPESVTEICDAAFFECTSLTEIVIPDRITEISNSAFENCSNLRKAVIPEGISKIGDRAFSGCKKLEKIVIPNGVSEIGARAFGGCECFKEHIDLRNVRSLGTNAFVASGITGITFSTAIKEIPSMLAASCENLTEVVIPEGVTKIGSEAFTMSNNITSITLPDSIEFIDFNAFPADEKLTITYKNKIYPYNDDTLFYSTFLEAPFTELPDGMTTDDICGMLYYNGEQVKLPFTIDELMELNESWKYDEEDLNGLPYAIFVFEVDETGNLTGNSTFLVTHKSGDLRSEDDVEKFFTLSGIDLGEFSIDKFKIGSSYSDFKAFFGEPGEAYPNSEELIDIEGVDYYYFKDEKRNVRFIVDYLDGKINNTSIIIEKRIHD